VESHNLSYNGAEQKVSRFIISLDFELMWGVRDHRSIQDYGRNILGARAAIPAMLKLFKKYQIRATWAAVGMLLFDSKKELLNHIPSIKPSYLNHQCSPYDSLDSIGDNEKEDPYHYALSLAQQIVECDGMELGSHTFSHYYCLEPGQSDVQFAADLEASVAACYRVSGVHPVSLVFPRNQYKQSYLPTCKKMGFRVFRGNEKSWMYKKSEKKDSSVKRLARLSDVYFNITGDNSFSPHLVDGMIDIPASRYLRSYNSRLKTIENFKCLRITRAMIEAAASGKCFHLWWHPHDFGSNLHENLAILETILKCYEFCRDQYGMISSTMGSASEY